MKPDFKHHFITIISCVFLFSCTDDYFEFDSISVRDWNPELAIPLINSSLTLEDIIISQDSNGIVKQEPDGLLKVVYTGGVYTDFGVAGISLNEASFNETFSGLSLPNSGSANYNYNSNLNYQIQNSIEIDSCTLKNGVLTFTVSSEFQHNLSLAIRFPKIFSNNGEVLRANLNLPASNGNQTVVRAFDINLRNYKVDFTNGGTTINTIPYEVDITFNIINGNPSSTSDELRFSTRIQNTEFKVFHGYIGQTPFDLRKDTILISLLKNFKTGTFFISNPTLDINITNSFGIPMSIEFDQLLSINQGRNRRINYNDEPLTNIVIASPTSTSFAETTSLELNRSNSNIDSIVSELVKEIAYDSRAIINPQGNDGTRNFLSDTSRIGLGIKLSMPFAGFITNLILVDTLDINLESFNEFKSGIIRTIATNGFPLAANIQLLFTDSAYNVIDSLYENGGNLVPGRNIIPSAVVDENGRVVQSSNSIEDTEVERIKFLNLSNSKYIIVKATLESTKQANNPSDIVKFFPEYRLDLKVGAKATVNIQ